MEVYNLDEDEEAYSPEFERMGYEAKNYIGQCGLFLPNIVSVFPVILLFYVLKLLKRVCPKLMNRLL